jgi:hypothetical protein
MERYPKKSHAIRDLLLALMALPIGIALAWASYGTSIDVIITVVLVIMGLFGLMFIANSGASSSEL